MQKHSEGFVVFAIYAYFACILAGAMRTPILRPVGPRRIGALPDLTESRNINA